MGSMRVAVTASSVQTMDYDPYGNRLMATPMRKGHNDRELDPESGMAEHGMRKYAAGIGRFIKGDRLWEKYPSLNPYQYANNNPMRMMDPSGDSIQVCDEMTPDEINQVTDIVMTVAQTESQELISTDPNNQHVADQCNSDDRIVQVRFGDIKDRTKDAITQPIVLNRAIVGVEILLRKEFIMGTASISTKAALMAHELKHGADLLSENGIDMWRNQLKEAANPKIEYYDRTMEQSGFGYQKWFFSAYHKIGGPTISTVGVWWYPGLGPCSTESK